MGGWICTRTIKDQHQWRWTGRENYKVKAKICEAIVRELSDI